MQSAGSSGFKPIENLNCQYIAQRHSVAFAFPLREAGFDDLKSHRHHSGRHTPSADHQHTERAGYSGRALITTLIMHSEPRPWPISPPKTPDATWRFFASGRTSCVPTRLFATCVSVRTNSRPKHWLAPQTLKHLLAPPQYSVIVPGLQEAGNRRTNANYLEQDSAGYDGPRSLTRTLSPPDDIPLAVRRFSQCA